MENQIERVPYKLKSLSFKIRNAKKDNDEEQLRYLKKVLDLESLKHEYRKIQKNVLPTLTHSDGTKMFNDEELKCMFEQYDILDKYYYKAIQALYE